MWIVPRNNHLVLWTLVSITKHIENSIRQSQLKQWQKLVSLDEKDTILKQQITSSQSKPGFPNF